MKTKIGCIATSAATSQIGGATSCGRYVSYTKSAHDSSEKSAFSVISSSPIELRLIHEKARHGGSRRGVVASSAT